MMTHLFDLDREKLLVLRIDCISALQYWRVYLPSSAPPLAPIPREPRERYVQIVDNFGPLGTWAWHD